MKTFDELKDMTDEQRIEYLHEEVEKIIANAPKQRVLKLRSIQARMDGIRRRYKDPLASASMIYSEMLASLYELNDTLKAALKE